MDVVQGFRKRDFPTPMTAEVLVRAGVPDSLAPRTLQALKLLDLVDAEGMPTEAFADLAKAPESEFPDRLATVLRSAYQEVFQFVEPREDGLEKVRDAFRVYKPRGQQDRMVTLFMGLSEVAGLVDETPTRKRPARKAAAKPPTHSPMVSAPISAASISARPTKKDPPGTISSRSIMEGDFQPSPPPASGQHPFIRGLIQELPPAGSRWPLAKRQRWSRAALAAFDVIYELPPEDEKGGE